MFGGPQAIGTELTDEDLANAESSLRTVADATAGARDAVQLVVIHLWAVARGWGAPPHGAVLLELGGYLGNPMRAREIFVAVTDAVLAGMAPSAADPGSR